MAHLSAADDVANGNVKPKAVIRGPKSGMANISSFQIYATKGLIIAGCDGGTAASICAWSVEDNGACFISGAANWAQVEVPSPWTAR